MIEPGLPSDLVRNFVFMHVAPDDHDEFDSDWWAPLERRFTRDDGTLDEKGFSRFLRDFLMTSGRYVQPRDTFATFEARYEATEFSPRELARTLNDSGEYYQVISGQKKDLSDAVTAALAGLNSLESSTTYSILLALLDRRDRGLLSDDELADAITMLRGFILRRFVCGESSRGYGHMFVRAAPTGDADPIGALRSYLLERGWPDDRRFEAAFVEFPLYERGYAKARPRDTGAGTGSQGAGRPREDRD